MEFCSCLEVLGNTGQSNCPALFKVMKKAFIVPTFDSTGARNKIDKNTVLSQAVLDAYINNTDKSVRWYPTPDFDSVTGERSESVFHTAPSGRKVKVKDGTRTVNAQLWQQDAVMLDQLSALNCRDWSMYIVDSVGSIRGSVRTGDTTNLYPIRIDKASFDGRLVFANDTESEYINLSWDWHQDETDAKLRIIMAGDITADVLGAVGLLDVSIVVHAITTTTARVSFYERFGSEFQKNKIKGLVVANMISSTTATASKIRDTTGGADLTVSSLTEETGTETETTGPGSYLITWTPAQTAADILQPALSKSGFDFTDVLATTIVIP